MKKKTQISSQELEKKLESLKLNPKFSSKYENTRILWILKILTFASAILGILLSFKLYKMNFLPAAVVGAVMIACILILYRQYNLRFKSTESYVLIFDEYITGKSVATKYYGSENVYFRIPYSDILTVDLAPKGYIIIISKYCSYKVFAGRNSFKACEILNKIENENSSNKENP